KEIPISFFAVVIVFILSNSFFLQENNVLSRIDGALLLILFILFLFYVYKQMKTEKTEFEIATLEISNWKIWGLITIGLAGLIFGGRLVVNNAIEIATNLGVSEKIIGLTIIAAGTSLPELVTSVVAAFKKNSDIAIGNIVGSNIFNLLLILSVSSFIKPVTYNLAFNTDVYMLAGGTLFLFAAMFSGKKKKLDRWEAAVLLAVFLIYTTYLIAKEI
ncbi:MAG: sodium:calcium antiporter, partial [Bacteroidota bacterium]|nr:sodium:calcium antiporter [Bacteroidota bacterium]